jgi:hypothetical protein
MAGIEHLVRRLAPELLTERTFHSVYELRNQIVHGLRPLDELEAEVQPLVPDLQLCLGVGALVARRGPTKDAAYGWKGALPRDNEDRPDARTDSRPPVALPDEKPYFGGWIDVTRESPEPDFNAKVGNDGVYELHSSVRTSFTATVPLGITEDQISRGYVLFERSGLAYYLTDNNVTPPKDVKPIPWRDRLISPAWERARQSDREDQSEL